MSPGSGDFDPKLYQYGGLWIYPIGGLLQVASKLGFITLTGDLSFYLDNPQAFGRFYLVARLYVVAWAVIGVWVVYQLTLRLSDRRRDAAVAAGLLFIVLPIVVNMSHEAKPHLPGAVLMLATCLAAIRYTQSLDARWWWSTTILAGAAMSMVLSAWPGLLILPVALLLTRQPRRHRVLSTIRGWLVSGAVYVIWNPYVLLNLAWNRERLISNLANTRDMFTFGISLSGISNGLSLVTEGTGVIVPIMAVACLLACSVSALARFERRPRSADHPSPAGTAVLGIVLVPAGVNLLQFMLFAVEQPGEYARFALFFDLVLALVAVVLVGRLLRPYKPDGVLLLPLLAPLMALPGGSGYLRGFVADVKPPTTRTRAADLLEDVRGQGARSLAVFREPAPYCLPPVNLFDWEIVLLPDALTLERAEREGLADAFVQVVDALDNDAIGSQQQSPYTRIGISGVSSAAPSDMQWADKPFMVSVRESLLAK
jgi:4-amino-4-deoxy-L-arabinose transferase-like glycosyltransferase